MEGLKTFASVEKGKANFGCRLNTSLCFPERIKSHHNHWEEARGKTVITRGKRRGDSSGLGEGQLHC